MRRHESTIAGEIVRRASAPCELDDLGRATDPIHCFRRPERSTGPTPAFSISLKSAHARLVLVLPVSSATPQSA
jgi:hypothetical protein